MLTVEQIKSAALRLEPADREALAEELLLSIQSTDREEIDTAWLTEVRQRDAAFCAGTTAAKPVNEVIDRLKKKALR